MKSDSVAVITSAFEQNDCSWCVLSKRSKSTSHDATRVTIRPLQKNNGLCYQFSYRIGNAEHHENHTPTAAQAKVTELLGEVFLNGHLYTSQADHTIRISSKGKWHLKTEPPSKQAAEMTHDKTRNYLIPDGQPCDFLHAIGVMTDAGQVRQSKYRKFRQINRFLELVNDIVPALPEKELLRVVDFGCGKSYLTFALYHLLANIHQRDVEIVGLDRNPSVIEDCQRVARDLKCTGLSFQRLNISEYERTESVHLAVSLHACDTATDDMLAQAVGWQANVILAVPCCQHELFQKIESKDLTPLVQHGLLKERFAALATDALRASALEIVGYQTQVVEFIDMEHTAKNVLIRAVRRPSSSPTRDAHRQTLRQMCDLLGIDNWALGKHLPEIWESTEAAE